MIRDFHPRSLRWDEVDPARHPFDAADALDVVLRLAPPVPAPPGHGDTGPREEAERWRDAVGERLAGHYGRWAAGWCWSTGEGDWDGGPVDAWCCPAHSIGTPDETLRRVAAGLVQWRAWLEELAGRFARAGDPELDVVELVGATAERTDGDSAWYGHCRQVLRWYLTVIAVPAARHDELIDRAIGGRFRSWVQPSGELTADVARRLAEDLPATARRAPDPAARVEDGPAARVGDGPAVRGGGDPAARAGDEPGGRGGGGPAGPGGAEPAAPGDALEAWRRVRAAVGWDTAAAPVRGPVRGPRDGVRDYYQRRSPWLPVPAAVLDAVRAEAATGRALTFERLAAWQAEVLGVDEAGFRTGPAFAKRGRERYGWRPGLRAEFEQRLAEAAPRATPLPSRAARLYLDIAFYHPFADGNARAAGLALYHLLARDGVVLDWAAPILAASRPARDAAGAAGLARLIERLIAATARRAGSVGG